MRRKHTEHTIDDGGNENVLRAKLVILLVYGPEKNLLYSH